MTPEQARAIAAPDSWPWPMSEEAKEWVENVLAKSCKHEYVPYYEGIEKCRHCHDTRREQPQQFNRAEHERFMRGL